MRLTWLGITSVLLMQLFLLMLFSLLPGMPWDVSGLRPHAFGLRVLMCALAADKSHQCLRQHFRFRQHQHDLPQGCAWCLPTALHKTGCCPARAPGHACRRGSAWADECGQVESALLEVNAQRLGC